MTNAAESCYSDVFFFFVAAAVIGVLLVFDSASVDYRFVALGSLLPLLEALSGRPLVLHTLLGSVSLLTLAMAFTVRRRVLRRRVLGIPIGTFVFLIVSGVWTRTDLFWWPALGLDGIASPPLPEFDRPLAVLVLLELVGIGGMVWLIRRFALTQSENLRQLYATGRLPKTKRR